MPELKFSPIKIISFLLKYKKAPEEAINNVEQLISKLIKAKFTPPKIFKAAKLKDTRLICI